MTVIDILPNRKYHPRSKPADVVKKEKELINYLKKLGKKYKASDSLYIIVELRHYLISISYENKEQKLCLNRVAITLKRKYNKIWLWSEKASYDSEDSDRFFQKNDMNKIKEKIKESIMEEFLKEL